MTSVPHESDLIIMRDEIMKILNDGPILFDIWLATLPEHITFNIRDSCSCFFHQYILDKASLFVWACPTEVRIPVYANRSSMHLYFPDNYKLPKWCTEFQDKIMRSKYDEGSPISFNQRYPSTARKVLRDIMGVNYGGWSK